MNNIYEALEGFKKWLEPKITWTLFLLAMMGITYVGLTVFLNLVKKEKK